MLQASKHAAFFAGDVASKSDAMFPHCHLAFYPALYLTLTFYAAFYLAFSAFFLAFYLAVLLAFDATWRPI